MKYLLINKQTGEKTLCDKVTIDGFDYYVSDEKFKDLKSDSNYLGFVFNHLTNGQFFVCNKINELINEKYQTIWNNSDYRHYSQWYLSNFIKSGSWEIHKVIATNNPNINIPKVVDEVEKLAKKYADEFEYNELSEHRLYVNVYQGFIQGYNKSQETHPFSYEDADAYAHAVINGCLLSAKEWKSQQPIKVYYA
jgi:hypothetical protein